MVVLNNSVLEVHLEPVGAEISKIIGLKDNMNYMWKQDPVLWGHSAPVLFPIVGALKNNEAKIDGKTYVMTQHGFSRDTEYKVDEVDDTHVVFHLSESEETLKKYPYHFDVYVTYTLDGSTLKTQFKVVNQKEDAEIWFQIGGHPAFACPMFEGEDPNTYYIEFSEKENVESKLIDVENKGMSRTTLPLFKNEQRFFVRQALFNNDAIVVPHFKSESVSLKNINHDKAIVFHMRNFDHVGIWTSKHVGGLLAIEPWVGHIDYVDFDGEFKEKESCQCLKQGEEFIAEFDIEIHE